MFNGAEAMRSSGPVPGKAEQAKSGSGFWASTLAGHVHRGPELNPPALPPSAAMSGALRAPCSGPAHNGRGDAGNRMSFFYR